MNMERHAAFLAATQGRNIVNLSCHPASCEEACQSNCWENGALWYKILLLSLHPTACLHTDKMKLVCLFCLSCFYPSPR